MTQRPPSSNSPATINLDSLEGILERIVYFNEENNFTVARLQVKGQKDLVAIVGSMALPNPGETLRLKGHWITDSKFGQQFRVESCLTVMPSTVTGIEKYLGSGLVKGIGPIMAKRIVALFGIDTLDVIGGKPERLLEVEGIGPIRSERISKAWEEQKSVREVMVFLQGHGVSSTYAVKIYKAYGEQAVKIVSENPYRLALDISGIGFKTADKIARNMGIDPASKIRAEAGIIHVLSEQVGEGHVYYPQVKLAEAVAELLEVDQTLVESVIPALVQQRRIIVEDRNGEQALFLTALYTAEVNAAKRLLVLMGAPKKAIQIDIEKAILWAEQSARIELADLQKQAIRKAVTSKALIITGGPGTGKTTLINCLIRILEAKGQKILLASPTFLGQTLNVVNEGLGYT